MSFILKLSIDKGVTFPAFVEAIYELPVDTMFLSITLVAAAVMRDGKGRSDSFFLWFLVGIFLTILSVIIWRKTIYLHDKGGRGGFTFPCILLLF